MIKLISYSKFCLPIFLGDISEEKIVKVACAADNVLALNGEIFI